MGKKTNSAAENIKVLVRCRPLNDKEKSQGYKTSVDLDLTENTVTVQSVVGEPDRWTFDAVINNTFTQKDVFQQFIMPLVDSVLDGFNATVFAYGQSGSGKTHTMTGKLGDEDLKGLTPRSFEHVFDRISSMKATEPNKQFSLYVSFIELYNGKVHDLLARQQVPLALKENKDKSFFVQGAHIPQVKCIDDIFHQMEEGTERRRVAATELNADSSRSHSVFTLIIECTEVSEDGDSRSVTSKLNLVDLAGSERQSKTGALGDTLKEGCNINLSLSALGTVIDTIVKGKGHVPFRSSPLTMILKDSLGGSSKTVMFANINPSEHNVSETISTLRFADRAKQIKNKPVVNLDTKDQKIVELTELVHELREKLKKYDAGGTGALEQDVDDLTEKMGEMQVSLDNAVKAREADRADFENIKAMMEQERQNLTATIAELEERIATLQSDQQLAESNINAERLQREEILRLCSHYLRTEGGEEKINNATELEAVLRGRAHERHSSEMVGVQNELQKVQMELKQSLQEREAMKKEMSEKMQESKAALKSAESKLKKYEKKLSEAKEALKNAASSAAVSSNSEDGGSAASEKEVAKLRIALESAQKELEGRGAMANVEAKLQEIQKTQDETTRAYLEQMKQAREILSTPGESDSAVVKQLRNILKEDDKTYNIAVEHMKTMQNITTDLVAVVREAQIVPMVALNGDAAASQKALKKLKAVDASEAQVYANALSSLHDNVNKAHGQRNRILEALTESSEAPVDLREELRRVVQENNELRQRSSQLTAEVENLRLQATAELRNEVAKTANSPTRRDKHSKNAGDTAATGLKRGSSLLADADDIRVELEEERERNAALAQARVSLQEEVKALRAEAAEAEKRYVELQGKMRETMSEYERRLENSQGGADEIANLTSRLKERGEQVEQMRGLLEKQKALIVRSNQKSEALQQKLRDGMAEWQEKEMQYRQKIQERDENFQRVLNQRLQESTQNHRDETEQIEAKMKKLKKKIKKMEMEVDKCKEDYDRKVCECEELRNAVEEHKVDHMRLLRRMGQTAEEAQVYEKKEQIQNALERAKEERRRKKDLFALGEVENVRRADF
ncbi:kinesin, putative [Trypanosoma equiperdum]|uniref:OSM3-like kinesin, putative n=4 Tax=Trypanozoon TaxID=39700 RepID=Q57ZS8_TRYB2|nr:OSM3-like kinesin, putative [Trypanosoma brucei gambiense DAL972]XP_844883.1 OSM3-like kinesin, putative [Trypanosoma brucei brucei TREU927]AAX79088.1 OSM3-like kinesin, putative [Trypanosoma brucei]RHW72446.1 kinesin [Trypanosoma brucei equiperdum]SCU70578.1 kinesin, putative [Trypanosoma equiperdum]AAZ11324.1 OSM3-like kinesin, putative [Trypanosoma brucei brucei TREU927]CBH11159.1 OSM3-like kinesin, putative [Trypanosoma brucei gambiense DAL972]|eukprot:XP_011773446.1 OSM3-like kinesin, putative [Trypanosoma brucei gambiense DAL972]